MSLLFLEADIMTVEVHDHEGNKPSEGNCLRPSVLVPGTIAGAMSSKSKDDATKDDDSSESSTSSPPKWKRRRTRNDVVALKYRVAHLVVNIRERKSQHLSLSRREEG